MFGRVSVAALALALFVAPAAARGEDAPARLVVEVGTLRNLKGTLNCLLFARAEGFPNEPKKAQARVALTPTGNAMRCVFEGLPAGRYAISVLHDEDESDSINTNFIGIPTEGYGASNNVLPALSAPEFEASAFSLAAGEARAVSVTLKY
jgi:uncharacterized protein (DUF2141 family)